MDIFKSAERLMGMSESAWARHANPWSVYTRIGGGTLTFLALWSPFWIGWAGGAAIAAALLWTWLNPRLFPPPLSVDSWATKGVLGERIFLNRKTVPIPAGHHRAATITTGVAAVFLASTVYGFIKRDFALALVSWHAATLAKLWFCDRMVWLWEEMKDAAPQYRAWAQLNWVAPAEPTPEMRA